MARKVLYISRTNAVAQVFHMTYVYLYIGDCESCKANERVQSARKSPSSFMSDFKNCKKAYTGNPTCHVQRYRSGSNRSMEKASVSILNDQISRKKRLQGTDDIIPVPVYPSNQLSSHTLNSKSTSSVHPLSIFNAEIVRKVSRIKMLGQILEPSERSRKDSTKPLSLPFPLHRTRSELIRRSL